MNQRRVMRTKKKKRNRRRFFLLFSIILLAAIVYMGYIATTAVQTAGDSFDDLGREKSSMREQAVSISNDPISILLLGIEDYATSGEAGRADAILVATFNPNDEKLNLLSIPRDALVTIAGRETKDKINHAYAFGGEELMIETVENFLEIPIDYYATVNFDAFKNIIDILGGITVDVPFDFTEDSDDETPEVLYFTEGEMELDGREALAYTRMRYEDPRGDLGRNDRQQQVIEAMIDSALSMGTLLKVDDLATEIGNNVQTNVKTSDGIGFIREYSDFRTGNIQKLTFETEPTRMNGISYLLVTDESLANIQNELQTHLEMN